MIFKEYYLLFSVNLFNRNRNSSPNQSNRVDNLFQSYLIYAYIIIIMLDRLNYISESVEKKLGAQTISALANANRIDENQIRLNKLTLESPVAGAVRKMMEYVPIIYKNMDITEIEKLSTELGRFRRRFLPALSQIDKSELQYIVNLGDQQIREKKASNLIKKIDEGAQMAALENGKKLERIDINLKPINNPILKSQAQSTIQSQVGPIVAYLNRNIKSISPNNVPQSVKLLSQYAQTQGRKAFGSISSSKGRAFIGVGQSKQGFQTVITPFPIQRGNGKSPNLYANFQFYAGQAINSWNQFVKKEQNLVDFVNNVSTKQLRKSYVEERISQMNEATFSAEALATLTYYYVFIPMQKFAKQSISTYDGTRQSFERYYTPGDGGSRNPFFLNQTQALTIFTLLFQRNSPLTVLSAVLLEIQKMKTSINAKRISQFALYTNQRNAVARQFFQSSGLLPSQYQQRLLSPNIVGIKKMKFIIPAMFVNAQIAQLVNNVKNREAKQQSNVVWSLSWGDDQIMCHDYVWNYSL